MTLVRFFFSFATLLFIFTRNDKADLLKSGKAVISEFVEPNRLFTSDFALIDVAYTLLACGAT